MQTILASLFFIATAITSSTGNEVWQVLKSVDGIEIETSEQNCSSSDFPSQVGYILKFTNKNNYDCKVTWDLAVWYNNEKVVHDVADNENHHELIVKAGESVQGSCENPSGPLYIFKDFITYVSPTKLSRFELENLTVSKL